MTVSKKTIEKLNKQYSNKKIGDIEKEIKASNVLSLEARKEATFALLYLKHSSRYKENPVYRKSSFESYLIGCHNIRPKTFAETVRGFDLFDEETKRYGIGLVSKVARKCGKKNQKQVLAEIQKADSNLKNPIQRAKIETIIEKHARPELPKNNYKTMYFNEVRQHEATKERYKDVVSELKAAKKQIEKLQATVLELRPLREMKEAIKPFMATKGTRDGETGARANC